LPQLPDKYVKNEDEINLLIETTKSFNKIIIKGIGGSGKSTLLVSLSNELKNKKEFLGEFVFFINLGEDLKQIKKQQILLYDSICENYENEKINELLSIEQIKQKIKQKFLNLKERKKILKFILILDDVNHSEQVDAFNIFDERINLVTNGNGVCNNLGELNENLMLISTVLIFFLIFLIFFNFFFFFY
jgi:ABC-type phosphate/phosphonate transport system ATPase subunit